MKKPIIAVAVAAALVSPSLFAQSANFQGFSAGLGVNVADTSTEVESMGMSSKRSDNDSNFALQLQYNMALSNTVVLGLGGTINMGDLKAGKWGTNQLKVTDAYSLYVAPGYAINNSWLVYGKLAYLNASEKASLGGSVSFDNGWGYGLGVQNMFNKNWFGQAEYMVNDYGKEDSAGDKVKLKSDVLTLSVGYKF